MDLSESAGGATAPQHLSTPGVLEHTGLVQGIASTKPLHSQFLSLDLSQGRLTLLPPWDHLGLGVLILLFPFSLGPRQPRLVPEQSFLCLSFNLKVG